MRLSSYSVFSIFLSVYFSVSNCVEGEDHVSMHVLLWWIELAIMRLYSLTLWVKYTTSLSSLASNRLLTFFLKAPFLKFIWRNCPCISSPAWQVCVVRLSQMLQVNISTCMHTKTHRINRLLPSHPSNTHTSHGTSWQPLCPLQWLPWLSTCEWGRVSKPVKGSCLYDQICAD